MTDEQKAAYVQSQVVCAMAEAFGMMSENMQRAALGQSMAYDASSFEYVINKYGISHNAVLTFFQG